MNPQLPEMSLYPYSPMGHSIPQSTNAQLNSAKRLISTDIHFSLSNTRQQTLAEIKDRR